MNIEGIVGEFYKIERASFYSLSKHRSRVETEALHFVWFLRHYKEGLSIGKLSKIYARGQRGIKHGVAKIKNYIKYEKGYNDTYNYFLKEIDKEKARDNASPKEKKDM